VRSGSGPRGGDAAPPVRCGGGGGACVASRDAASAAPSPHLELLGGRLDVEAREDALEVGPVVGVRPRGRLALHARGELQDLLLVPEGRVLGEHREGGAHAVRLVDPEAPDLLRERRELPVLVRGQAEALRADDLLQEGGPQAPRLGGGLGGEPRAAAVRRPGARRAPLLHLGGSQRRRQVLGGPHEPGPRQLRVHPLGLLRRRPPPGRAPGGPRERGQAGDLGLGRAVVPRAGRLAPPPPPGPHPQALARRRLPGRPRHLPEHLGPLVDGALEVALAEPEGGLGGAAGVAGAAPARGDVLAPPARGRAGGGPGRGARGGPGHPRARRGGARGRQAGRRGVVVVRVGPVVVLVRGLRGRRRGLGQGHGAPGPREAPRQGRGGRRGHVARARGAARGGGAHQRGGQLLGRAEARHLGAARAAGHGRRRRCCLRWGRGGGGAPARAFPAGRGRAPAGVRRPSVRLASGPRARFAVAEDLSSVTSPARGLARAAEAGRTGRGREGVVVGCCRWQQQELPAAIPSSTRAQKH